jgi:hypothetical protein
LKTALILLVIYVESLLACRMVCSTDAHLYHMYSTSESENNFEIAEDTDVLASDLECVLLETILPSTEKNRMINSCRSSKPREDGSVVYFKSEIYSIEKIENHGLVKKEFVRWTVSQSKVDQPDSKTTHHEIEFLLTDCSSASDR